MTGLGYFTVACVVAAFILALKGVEDWGCFLFVALIIAFFCGGLL